MFGIGMPELIIIGIIGVLLFGKRLPEVGRSLGKGIMEFKKGVQGIEHDLDKGSSRRAYHEDVDDRDEPEAPKFQPPAGEPKDESVGA